MQQRLLVSFLSTNYSELRKHWKKFSVLRDQGKRGSDRPFTKPLGGKIVLLDWQTKQIVWEISLESPSGITLHNEMLYVNSIEAGSIIAVDPATRAMSRVINHPHFNKPHSLCRSSRGFLVSSTGLDSILEVTENGDTLFEICLIDHGYHLDQFGERRVIDRNINHQRVVYPSLRQTTHVNYARYLDPAETMIIASLFHPGQIVKIDKTSLSIDVLVDGLKQPHGASDFDERRYMVCDSGRNRIVLVDRRSNRITEAITDGFSWIQDAVLTPNGDLYIADADNYRILKANARGQLIDSFSFPSDYRIYQILPAKENEARLFYKG